MKPESPLLSVYLFIYLFRCVPHFPTRSHFFLSTARSVKTGAAKLIDFDMTLVGNSIELFHGKFFSLPWDL